MDLEFPKRKRAGSFSERKKVSNLPNNVFVLFRLTKDMGAPHILPD
jgi:hypothetical protein